MSEVTIYYDLLDDVDEAARNGRYSTETGNILFDPIRPTKAAIQRLREDGFKVNFFLGFLRFNFIRISWVDAKFGQALRIKRSVDLHHQRAQNYVKEWDVGNNK